MSGPSTIEWTEMSWNPVTGCTEVSPGCDHCYAKTFAERWRGTVGHPYEKGFDLTLRPQRLDDPLRWRTPKLVFVNSMSDLFHSDIPVEYIVRVFQTMAVTPQHTYQVLTKRAERMERLVSHVLPREVTSRIWPLPNVWLGVSVESEAQVWRIRRLAQAAAAVRFLSLEPLLGPLPRLPLAGIHWVIAGGESGPGARPMHPDWVRDIRDQCSASDALLRPVPFFFKQWGAWVPPTELDHAGWDDVAMNDRGVTIDPTGRVSDYGPSTSAEVRMWNVGKGRAGRMLDGRTWDAMPERAAVPV